MTDRVSAESADSGLQVGCYEKCYELKLPCCNVLILLGFQVLIKGLQNLYAWVRFPPAPPETRVIPSPLLHLRLALLGDVNLAWHAAANLGIFCSFRDAYTVVEVLHI